MTTTRTRTSPNRGVKCSRCSHPYALHSNGTTPCLARSCHKGPDGTPCPRWQAPFLITEDMIVRDEDGMPKPGFSTNTVATAFTGRSSAWLRVKMRGIPEFPDVYRSPSDARWFSLADIERAAHALHQADVITDDRLAGIIMVTLWCARLYDLPVIPGS